MIKNNKEIKGITLIALIVTIIVLLILAGVSISFLVGENGILDKAALAKSKSSKGSEEENGVLESYNQLISDSISSRNTVYSSTLVTKVDISGSQILDHIEINCSIEKNKEDINYIAVLYVNGKLFKSYTKTEMDAGNIKYYNVEPTKKYDFYTLIIDEDGGITKSNILSITSGTSSYQWTKTQYPVLTISGIANMQNSDQYGNVVEYKKDLTQGNCLAADSLPMEAWDGNTSTCVRTGTFYIKIDSSMIGKTLVWNQYWLSGCSSTFSFCDVNKTALTSWGSDISGTKVIISNTQYMKYTSNGHYLYEVYGQ